MNSKLLSSILITALVTFNPVTVLDVSGAEAATKKKQSKPKRRDIFADPENLKVLSDEISSEQLRQTMRSFALGLGLRCLDCHVGEEGKLETYDFASDKKKLKKKARVMLAMVKDINGEQLTKLDKIEKGNRVSVRCITCHRGQQKPELIQDVLVASYSDGGIAAAVEKYAELRKKYHGSHTFDFSESMLPRFAGDYLNKEETMSDAISLLEANQQYFPESFFGSFSLAKAYEQSGEKEKAIKEYEHALKINPKAGFVKKKLEKIEKLE